MKNKFTSIVRYFLMGILPFLMCIATSNSAQAQIINYPSSASAITRGLDSTTLTVHIVFPGGCTNPLVTINLGATNTPGLVEYIPGSVVKTSGTATLNITESNISNLAAPVFTVNTPTVGQEITFTIRRRVACGVASATKDNITVSGSCSFSETDINVNTYNLLSPSLTVTPPSSLANVDLGIAYNRTFTVINGGNGCLDTLFVWIKYPTASATLNSLKIGATSLTPVFTNGDSTLFKIAGANLPGGDNLMCNSETIIFTENVTFLKCNATSRYGTAWNNYTNQFCEADINTGNIIMSSNTPNLTASLPAPYNTIHDYCFTGDSKIQTIKIENTGSGSASNIDIFLTQVLPGNFQGKVFFDTTAVWNIKNSSGIVIGSVTGFNNASYSSGNISNSSCGFGRTAAQELKAFLNNIVLAPGDYLTIDVVTIAQNVHCISCIDVTGWLGIQSEVNYKNQCGTATYTDARKTLAERAYTYLQYTVENPSDINGTAPNNTFNLDLFFSSFRTQNNPNGNGSTRLAIPILGKGISPNATNVTTSGGLITTLPITVVNDTMFIDIPQGLNVNNVSMSIPMKANCSAGDGTKNLNIDVLNKYSLCSIQQKLSCRNSAIYIHCPTPCPKGGATPINFSLKRINLGLPDNDNNSLPDATGSINLALIKDHHSVNGDTLMGTWNIKVYPNTDAADPNFGGNISYVYVDMKIKGQNVSPNSGSLTALPNAAVTVYPAGGGAPINFTVSPTLFGSDTTAHYEMSVANRGGFWQGGDSIVVKAKYTVNAYNADRYSFTNLPGFYLFNTNNEVYSSYSQKATPQTAPITGQTYTCDHYNDYNQMSYIWFSPYIPANQTINGCNNLLVSYFRQYLRNQEVANIFPYEYRNFYIPQDMKVVIPPGCMYRPNSAYYQVASRPISNANVVQVGDTLFFKNLNTFYTTYGGTLIPSDEYEDAVIVYFSIDPTCAAANGTYYNQITQTGIGNSINTPTANYNGSSVIKDANSSGWIYTAPQSVLSGGSTVLSSDGTASWNLALQNLSNTSGANNTWFYISPKNGITNIVVKEGATVIPPDANGFYQLGSLVPSANRTFTITAKTTTCGLDSMRINQGYECGGYPTSFSLQSCTKSTWLKIDNYPSQIQLTVVKQPTTPNITLCTTETIEFLINSSQGAYADNPVFRIVPPTGLNITSGQIVHNGVIQTITPTIASGVYTYPVESHTGVSSKGLAGTFDSSAVAPRQAKLIITFTTDCNFTSGAKLVAQQRGDRPCGGTIPTALGYNNIVRTDPVNIAGVTLAVAANFTLGLTPANVACGASTVAGNVVPVGTSSQVGDTLVVTIPAGVQYNGSFVSSSGATLVAGSPFSGSGGTQILKVQLPIGVPSGTAINYSFSVLPSSLRFGCGNFEILSEYIRTLAALTCGAGTCPNGAKVVMGSDIQTITIDKPAITVTSFTKVGAGGNMAPGTTVTLTVAVANTSSVAAAPVNTMLVEFFCGTSTTPFTSQLFPNAVPANGSSTANFTVAIPNSPTCNTGEALKAVIRPSSNSCVCDSSSFTMVRLLPIKLTSFIAQAIDAKVKLDWVVANQSDVKNYIIEYSANGTIYTTIETITANTVQDAAYTSYHSNPINGLNYYRIKIIEKTGVFSYTEVRKVNFGKNTKITVYPNPARNEVNITVTNALINKAAQLMLFSMDGRRVFVSQITNLSQTEVLNVSKLASGKYTLRIITNNEVINYMIEIIK